MNYKLKSVFAFCIICLFHLSPLLAWSDHTLGTYPSLSALKELQNAKPVAVESFEEFLTKEAESIAILLKEEEEYARKNIQFYLPRPDSLEFDPKDKKNIRKNFLRAMRLNPDVRLEYYIQEPLNSDLKPQDSFPIEKISIFHDLSYYKRLKFRKIALKSNVSPIAVVATAADEPDYGHDIGLFDDTETEFGKEYGFGKLPFGDARFEYNSQAPFHMGFMHESSIVYKLAPFVKKTFPEYRIHHYHSLARLAFKTGHPYWGYRITGWGLHFIQDLTQPFHSTLTPGIGLPRMLLTNTVSVLGWDGPKNSIIKRMADRHNGIERYHFEWMDFISRNNDTSNQMVKAFSDASSDFQYGEFFDKYPREVISKESNERSGELDSVIGNYELIVDFLSHTMRYEKSIDSEERHEVNEYLGVLMKSFGAHTRNYVRSILKN